MRETLPKRERVPAYHDSCEQSKALIETLTDASLQAREALADVAKQLFVASATWGLALWENQVGIAPDLSQPDEARRTAILQKLVANGNTTAEMVRALAETVTGYQARVLINNDYSFSLEFLGEQTTLANIDVAEVRAMVEQIKPAHLRFVITTLRWMDIEGLGLTWGWFDESPNTWYKFENELFCIHALNRSGRIPLRTLS